MSGKLQIEVPIEKIAQFCRKWQVRELSFFGSVLREDFRPESDIDVLVVLSPEAHSTIFDLLHMEEELKALLGRKVDLVEKRAIERSDNYIRRKLILNSAQVVYAA